MSISMLSVVFALASRQDIIISDPPSFFNRVVTKEGRCADLSLRIIYSSDGAPERVFHAVDVNSAPLSEVEVGRLERRYRGARIHDVEMLDCSRGVDRSTELRVVIVSETPGERQARRKYWIIGSGSIREGR